MYVYIYVCVWVCDRVCVCALKANKYWIWSCMHNDLSTSQCINIYEKYCCTLMHYCTQGLHSLTQPYSTWRLQNWSKTWRHLQPPPRGRGAGRNSFQPDQLIHGSHLRSLAVSLPRNSVSTKVMEFSYSATHSWSCGHWFSFAWHKVKKFHPCHYLLPNTSVPFEGSTISIWKYLCPQSQGTCDF